MTTAFRIPERARCRFAPCQFEYPRGSGRIAIYTDDECREVLEPIILAAALAEKGSPERAAANAELELLHDMKVELGCRDLRGVPEPEQLVIEGDA